MAVSRRTGTAGVCPPYAREDTRLGGRCVFWVNHLVYLKIYLLNRGVMHNVVSTVCGRLP